MLAAPLAYAGHKSLEQAYKASTGGAFHAVSAADAELAREAFATLLREPRITPQRQAQWARLGYALRAEGGVLTLAEQPDARWGRGFYAFTTDSEARHLLQAPHRYDDQHTGRIALELFASGRFRAAAWATLRRGEVDLAHTAPSLFTAFALAAAQTRPQEFQYQLHGFAARKCKSKHCATAQAIVSPGPLSWSAAAEARVECLSGQFADVRRYGKGIGELGGTRNAVARALQALGFDGFLHIEMERALRDRLVGKSQVEGEDAALLRANLLRCLAA